ncbi:Cytoskeleton protein RodZ [Marinomonas aquimarina]|uniref:Cytoskeleton protein RodZ n=1 Tax=Marinomonas aquimarina TaxID=295068 RepID=A0A1A8TB95_9GAMM|nr:RodZ domain-containing protein [Marinomonas aquimarina]SBS28843.1 Cytoskeleton protein RodZ [Marinomonas aquimarina]
MTTELEMDIAPEQGKQALDIGQTLRAKRLSLALDERQVATELKLSIDSVYALENGAFERFRSATFARGYLKSYCRLLGLDHHQVLAAFDEQQSVKESHLRPVDNVQAQSSGRDPIFVIVSAIIIAIIAFVVFWWPSQSSEPEESSAVAQEQVSDEMTQAAEDENTSNMDTIEAPAAATQTDSEVTDAEIDFAALTESLSDTTEEAADEVVTGLSAETIALLEDAGVDTEQVAEAAREPENVAEPATVAPEPVVASHDIVLQFSADCWTEIRDSSGRILFSGVKSAGSSLELDGQAPYRVTLGYAPGVSEFIYQGEQFDFSSYVRKDLARFELE